MTHPIFQSQKRAKWNFECVDPVDHYEEQRRKAEEVVRKVREAEADTIHFVITIDGGDLETLAERQNTECERYAALLGITRMMLSREREKKMESEK